MITQLRAGDPVRAWSRFLQAFSPLLLKVVRHNVRGDDQRGDCFIHVCEKLAEDGFRRLLAFDPAGRARFPTWLTVVATRLCIDWLRQTYGRDRPFANILRLPALEQRLFHFRHERGLDRAASFRALQAEQAGLDDAALNAALTQMEQTLTPDQRWRLAVRSQTTQSLEDIAETADGSILDDAAADEEAQRRLPASLAKLDPRDRLLLQYRFEEDLSFEQIAKLTGLGDPFRARRAVEHALARLRDFFSAD